MRFILFSASLFITALSKCPDGFQSVSADTCVRVGHATDFVSAALECSKSSGSLASVSSGFQNSLYKGVLTNVTGRVILGADNLRNGTYLWIDKMFMAFTNWGPGQPSSARANSISMDVSSGQWYSTPLESQLPYLCAAPVSNLCASDWSFYNGQCYKYFDAGLNGQIYATDAETYCVGFGAHLASIHDDNEDNFVLSLSPPNECSVFWIGLKCTSGSVYTWTDGTPALYRDNKSCANQPSYYGIMNRACGTQTQWIDAGVSNVLRNFVCKKAASK